MKNKYVFVTVMLVGILVASLGLTTISLRGHNEAEKKDAITVVTSFYPMYVACANIIGDTEGIELNNLSEPQTGCLHDYQLTPMDMQLLSRADVFVVNGGGIEGFLQEVAVAYPQLVIVEACDGIALLEEEEGHSHAHGHEEAHEEVHEEGHNHGDEGNAHAWMSVARYRMQIQNIADALRQVDPAHGAAYLDNAATYEEKLEALENEEKLVLERLKGESVILFHEAFAYTAEALGMEVVFTMDLDEERQVSAGEVASVMEEIEENQVKYIFAEEQYGKKMARTIQRECDVTVIYLNPLNRGDYEADSYLEGMQENLKAIIDALE